MNKIKFGTVICITIVALSGCGCSKDKNSSAEDAATNNQNDILIYLAKLNMVERDNLSKGLPLDCSDSVEGVEINKKLSPKEALEKLFVYKEYDKEEGLYNIFETSDDLKVENLLIQNDFAIVTLSEDLNLNEACDSERVYAQISKTLKQFDDIDGVDIFVGDKELKSYILEKEVRGTNP